MTVGAGLAAILGLATALVSHLPDKGAPSQEPAASPPGASSATGPTPGETYRWRPVAIGGGGFITGLSQDAAGQTLVARSDVYGAYRWDTSASRWVQMVTSASMPASLIGQAGGAGGVYEVVVAPANPQRIYMAVAGRLLRSDDNGEHFRDPMQQGPFPVSWDANSAFRLAGPFIAVGSDKGDTVLLGTPQGLWRSTDGGGHWQAATLPKPVAMDSGLAAGIPLWTVPNSGARVLAAPTGKGMWISDASGLNFTRLGAGDGPETVWRATVTQNGDVLAIDRTEKMLWMWHGAKWQEMSNQGGLARAEFVGIAADASGRLIVDSAGGQAWCSPDRGVSWVNLNVTHAPGPGEPPWLRYAGGTGYFASGELRFDTGRANWLWLAAGVGPFTADIGVGCPADIHWSTAVSGIEELVAQAVSATPGHAPIFANLDFGIHLKGNLDAFSTVYGPVPRDLIAAQDLATTPADSGFVVTNASDTRQDCCSYDGNSVMAGYSQDGGAHWTKFASLPTPPGTQEGDPWRMAYGTIAVSADSADNIVWLPGFNHSAFYTKDRGHSWQRVSLPGENLPLTGAFDGKYLPRKTLAADSTLAHTFYLYLSGNPANAALTGLWRTGDGGASWQMAYHGEIAPDSRYAARLRAMPGKAGELFFTSSVLNGADTGLRRSTDGGATWQMLSRVDRVDDIAFGKAAAGSHAAAIYISGRVSGRYGIWRSTDDAASWQWLTDYAIGRLDRINVLGADPNVFGRIYIGYMGSGWIYGEPAGCAAAPYRSSDAESCSDVQH